MSWKSCFLVVLAGIAAGRCSVVAAVALDRTAEMVMAVSMAIDGVDCGAIVGWEGGDPRASVVSLPGTQSSFVGKQVDGFKFAPLVVQLNFPLAKPVMNWIGDWCAGKSGQKTIVLTSYGATGKATEAIEASRALLTEVRFPAFDASAKAIGPCTLVIEMEHCGAIAPTGIGRTTANRAVAASNFRLSIPGLSTNRVIRVEPITVTQRITADATGATRSSGSLLGPLEVSNLLITFASADAATWKAWLQDFVVKGNNGDAQEKSGSIEILGANTTTVLGALSFSHLGIMRVTRVPPESGALPREQAELYVERLSFGGAAAAGAADSKTTADNAKTAADASAGVAEKTTSLNNTNSADQGSRDPAEFPRAPGLTRISYSGTYQKTYTSESANYTAPEGVYEVVARVEQTAKAAGWEMATFQESESGGERSVTVTWSKTNAGATLGFVGNKDGATRLSLSVMVQKPGAN